MEIRIPRFEVDLQLILPNRFQIVPVPVENEVSPPLSLTQQQQSTLVDAIDDAIEGNAVLAHVGSAGFFESVSRILEYDPYHVEALSIMLRKAQRDDEIELAERYRKRLKVRAPHIRIERN